MFHNRTKLLRVLSISAMLLMGVGFVMWKSFAHELTNRSQTTQRAGDTSLTVENVDQLEVEFITLRPSGFEPSEIRRPKGSFVLLVEDRSGKANSLFTLQRIQGEHLREINTNRMKFEWYDVLNLPPGDYLVIDNNSNSSCHIAILP
ncbi:MAG TPA: hypothetical protein VJ875_14515 [Pyrinomonadaceae bacterium]|nr:hypothetical protein [Pyrinomonadaceae bacterium]